MGLNDVPPVRVLVVDDQGVVRAGLRMIIDYEADLEVVGEAADGRQAVDAVRALHPDVVLMDIRMPHQDGISATREIMAADEPPAVLVLTTFADTEYVLGAVRAGARGFLLKDSGPEALVAAVRTLRRGDALVDPQVTGTLIARCLELEASAPPPGVAGARWDGPLARLSEREREMLRAVGSGLANKEIAAALHVSESTVKTHISSIFGKLGVTTRVQAVVLAYEHGVVTPGGADR